MTSLSGVAQLSGYTVQNSTAHNKSKKPGFCLQPQHSGRRTYYIYVENELEKDKYESYIYV